MFQVLWHDSRLSSITRRIESEEKKHAVHFRDSRTHSHDEVKNTLQNTYTSTEKQSVCEKRDTRQKKKWKLKEMMRWQFDKELKYVNWKEVRAIIGMQMPTINKLFSNKIFANTWFFTFCNKHFWNYLFFVLTARWTCSARPSIKKYVQKLFRTFCPTLGVWCQFSTNFNFSIKLFGIQILLPFSAYMCVCVRCLYSWEYVVYIVVRLTDR